MSAQVTLRGCLKGHNGWVTSLAASPVDADTLVSSSRDHTCLVWKLHAGDPIDDPTLVMSCGTPVKSFEGHSHIVQDVSLSYDGQYALTASWDHSVRLWNVATGMCEKTLSGHSKDVLSEIVIYDLEKKEKVASVAPEFPKMGKKGTMPSCTCLCWSMDGASLFTGYTDNVIRVWEVKSM
ncbi:WD repeat protein [Blastocystis sp. ATCC 50177/Nand II]|uniref:WD repeat protein n=1 Tax=Blastocystis sp. subtype 1 (strain ATCC 50177 / NandII) TaxID=478820 RepID=A0A196S966_BLAHN|nr:WD repeat protein [Blastocystis sp. ATCC 50177/Nand II]